MPKPTRDKDAPPTRDRILEVAEQVFTESGYNGANLAEIADRVGIRKASLYYHFKTKHELYAEVLKGIFQDLRDMLVNAVERQSSPGEQLDHLTDTFVDFIARKRHYAIMCFREVVDRNFELEDILREQVFPLLDLVVAFTKEGQKRGQIKPVDPTFMMLSFVGTILFYFAAAPIVLTDYLGEDPLGPDRLEAVKEDVKSFVRATMVAET